MVKALPGGKFSPEKLRLTQDFQQMVGVEKILTHIPVRKPNKQEFFRTKERAGWLETMTIQLNEDNKETYLVAPEIYSALPIDATPTLLVPTLNKQKILAVWPIKLPMIDGRMSPWTESAILGAETAIDKWIRIWTVFGWNIYVEDVPNPRSLCNFPVQANGAEMMRLAAIYGIERGVKICLPVHDAFLIEAPLHELDRKIAIMQQAMSDASRVVLNGFELRSDAKIVRYPERYHDERGATMWKTVQRLISELENGTH